jgi:hypothetical protein
MVAAAVVVAVLEEAGLDPPVVSEAPCTSFISLFIIILKISCGESIMVNRIESSLAVCVLQVTSQHRPEGVGILSSLEVVYACANSWQLSYITPLLPVLLLATSDILAKKMWCLNGGGLPISTSGL